MGHDTTRLCDQIWNNFIFLTHYTHSYKNNRTTQHDTRNEWAKLMGRARSSFLSNENDTTRHENTVNIKIREVHSKGHWTNFIIHLIHVTKIFKVKTHFLSHRTKIPLYSLHPFLFLTTPLPSPTATTWGHFAADVRRLFRRTSNDFLANFFKDNFRYVSSTNKFYH